MRRRPLIVVLALVLVVVVVANLSAAGEITLESLAAAISKITQSQDDFEKRLAVIEKELNIPTATPTQTVLATETAVASDTPTATRTAEPTSTPRPTRTAAPTATPTPRFSSVDFSEVVDEYENNRIRFEDRFVGKRVYITGEIDRLTERGDGYQIEFDGSGLDLVCRLSAAARADVLGLSIGDTAIAYGQAELDSNLFTDNDLLFKACSVASDADSVEMPPTASPTRRPTSTPRPTASPTRKPTSTPRPTSTRGPTSTPRSASAASATNTPAPAPTPHFIVNRERVNVRTGPGDAFSIIGTVAQGDRFDIGARNPSNSLASTWLEFCCVNDQQGWIYAPLLIVSHEISEIPVAANIPTPPSPTPTNTPVPAEPDLGGISIAPEDRCSPYNSDSYSYSQSVEPRIVAQQGGRIYSPYSGRYFASTRETDIEHIVARSEAHDSGLCAADSATKRAFANDLLNLTLASPSVNRHQKIAKDVAEWLPAMNQCWYVNQVVLVKRRYNLTMDQAEASRAKQVLASCASTALQFTDPVAGAPTPPPAGEQGDNALELYDSNRNGRITCAEAREHGIAPVSRGHPAYQYMNDRDNDGVVCE